MALKSGTHVRVKDVETTDELVGATGWIRGQSTLGFYYVQYDTPSPFSGFEDDVFDDFELEVIDDDDE